MRLKTRYVSIWLGLFFGSNSYGQISAYIELDFQLFNSNGHVVNADSVKSNAYNFYYSVGTEKFTTELGIARRSMKFNDGFQNIQYDSISQQFSLKLSQVEAVSKTTLWIIRDSDTLAITFKDSSITGARNYHFSLFRIIHCNAHFSISKPPDEYIDQFGKAFYDLSWDSNQMQVEEPKQLINKSWKLTKITKLDRDSVNNSEFIELSRNIGEFHWKFEKLKGQEITYQGQLSSVDDECGFTYKLISENQLIFYVSDCSESGCGPCIFPAICILYFEIDENNKLNVKYGGRIFRFERETTYNKK